MWEILQEKVYKICITDLDELKQRLAMEWAKLVYVVIASVVTSIGPDQWCIICTPFCNISDMLLLTGFKSGEFGGHSWGGINSGVPFGNNWMVALAQWTFQVSQGSVETLFRWGGKRLHHSAANLFRKRCTKFYQHRLSFVGDITKKAFWSLFFMDTVYIPYTFRDHFVDVFRKCSLCSWVANWWWLRQIWREVIRKQMQLMSTLPWYYYYYYYY